MENGAGGGNLKREAKKNEEARGSLIRTYSRRKTKKEKKGGKTF